MEIKEFHSVVSIAEAKERLFSSYKPEPESEHVALDQALYRVAAEHIIAPVDVPPFDRASMDGYAVLARDTFYADEENPAELEFKDYITAGDIRKFEIVQGEAVGIATGAPMPKGANAVVMVEYTHSEKGRVKIYRPVAPGENVMAAGSDIMRGETVVRKGTLLSPRETGVLAALGIREVKVYRKPKVAILSTGNEIIAPGDSLTFGKIYDVNSRAIADSVIENGGEPFFEGIVGDNQELLQKKLMELVSGDYDIIITSGGTSAGAGDISYKVIDELGGPGILVHGVAIKPGKPTIIGVAGGKPIFGLPGYPTSAMIVFYVFIAPIIRVLAGLPEEERTSIDARTSMRMFSAKGRYEYKLVNLVRAADGSLSAYPVLTGSGAITTLAEADGYIEVPENVLMLSEGEEVKVALLSKAIRPADLTIIGSHCIGVDLLLNLINKTVPMQAKIINVGSSGGLNAVKRGESDISGTRLIEEKTGEYNIPFLSRLKIDKKAYLVRGYDREQGFIIAKDNPMGIKGIEDVLRDDISTVNRNAGSGTRVLLDLELSKLAEKKNIPMRELVKKIKGYEIEAKSHSAVAAAVAYGRADIGLAIKTVAEQYELDFIHLKEEKYDLAIPREKFGKKEVQTFIKFLGSNEFKEKLRKTTGLKPNSETGKVIYSPE